MQQLELLGSFPGTARFLALAQVHLYHRMKSTNNFCYLHQVEKLWNSTYTV